MRLDCYHHLSGFHYLEEIVATLDEFRVKLDRLTRTQETLMASTTRLEAAVASALTLHLVDTKA